MSMPMDKIIKPSSVGQLPVVDEGTLAENGFYWREHAGVKVLVSKPLEDAGFVNGFSTRLGGVSAFPHGGDLNLAGFDDDSAENIAENRRRFLAVFGATMRLATVWQTHSDNFHIV